MFHRMILLLMLSLVGILGCTRGQPASGPAAAPEVFVSQPVVRQVTDFEEFSGRTDAMRSVEIRARVTGYLSKVHFKEGSEVKEGDLLFEIDPSTYEAEFQRATAALEFSKAHVEQLAKECERIARLTPSGAASSGEYDKAKGDIAEAKAGVRVAEAALRIATINLGFTKVRAPISGRISRQLIDPGNIVKADETALTTVVTLNPIYVYFDIDERTLLKIQRLHQQSNKARSDQPANMAVFLGLVDEEGFPHQGTLNFVDNRVEPLTGTLRYRAVFSNSSKSDRILSAGLFVRIRMPVGNEHSAILLSERALGTDQGQSFVYVVDDGNKVVHRSVQVGAMQGGLRVIQSGITAKDRVVLKGLQRIRPGDTVEAKEIKMPADSASTLPPLAITPGNAAGNRPSS
jgi:RND family efflux transporter MFP subunit